MEFRTDVADLEGKYASDIFAGMENASFSGQNAEEGEEGAGDDNTKRLLNLLSLWMCASILNISVFTFIFHEGAAECIFRQLGKVSTTRNPP